VAIVGIGDLFEERRERYGKAGQEICGDLLARAQVLLPFSPL
jgi:hypothetical protein